MCRDLAYSCCTIFLYIRWSVLLWPPRCHSGFRPWCYLLSSGGGGRACHVVGLGAGSLWGNAPGLNPIVPSSSVHIVVPLSLRATPTQETEWLIDKPLFNAIGWTCSGGGPSGSNDLYVIRRVQSNLPIIQPSLTPALLILLPELHQQVAWGVRRQGVNHSTIPVTGPLLHTVLTCASITTELAIFLKQTYACVQLVRFPFFNWLRVVPIKVKETALQNVLFLFQKMRWWVTPRVMWRSPSLRVTPQALEQWKSAFSRNHASCN